MGAILLSSEKRGRCDVGFEGTSGSDSTEELLAMPRGNLRRSVEGPGCMKRAYGVLAYESSLERRRKSVRFDEQQLDELRAMLPSSARSGGRNESVVMDTYRYIVTLQKQVEDLSAELLECEERTLPHQSASDQQPVVEVTKRDGVMDVRIVCTHRPGLLVDVMEAVESRGFTVTNARIACHSDVVSKYVSQEIEESATISFSTEGGLEEGDVEEELDSLKAMFVHAICEGR